MTILYYHQKVILPYSAIKIFVKGIVLQKKSNVVTLFHGFRQDFHNPTDKRFPAMSYKCYPLCQGFPLISEAYLKPSRTSTIELFWRKN